MENDFRLLWLETLINRTFNIIEETSMFHDLLISEGGKYRRILLKFIDGLGLLLNKNKPATGGESNGQTNGSVEAFGFPCLCFWTSTTDIQVEDSTLKESPESTSPTDKLLNEHVESKSNCEEDDKGSVIDEFQSILANQEDAVAAESKIESPTKIDIAENVGSTPSVVTSDLCIEDDVIESPQSAEDVEIQNITIKRKLYKHVLHLRDTTIVFDGYIEASNILDELSANQIGEKHLLFIVRSDNGPIPVPTSLEQAEEIMQGHLEFHLVYNCHLNQSVVKPFLSKMFLPLLKLEIRDDVLCLQNKDLKEVDVYQIMNLPHNDILTKQTLLSDLQSYLENGKLDDQEYNDIYFKISEQVREMYAFDPSGASFNKSQLEAIENACKLWTDSIENAVAVTRAKLNNCASPMEEVEFWIESSKYLSQMLQNINSDEMKTTVKLLTNDNNRCVANFNFHRSELEQLFLQAEDLSQYMTDLKPYFKLLHNEDVSLKAMSSLMPCLMEKLRLIWGISKYLSTAIFMGSLLQRIAHQLSKRAVAVIDTTGLSSESPDEQDICCQNVKEAKHLMDNWKKCYLEMRSANDVAGPLPPWEFDRKRLFENTDYLASICQNILDVFQILKQFDVCHRLGLEAAFYEVEQIKSFYLKIKQLPAESFELTFDPLQMANSSAWKLTMDQFRREVSSMDAEFLNILREGFGHLKSSRAALILVNNFSSLECRPSLKSLTKHVLKDVALKLIDEIEDCKLIFSKNQSGPFNYKNFPQVSSSIFWSQRLLEQLVDAVHLFRESDALETLKENVSIKFEKFHSEVIQFQKSIIEDWSKNVQSSAFILLDQNILKESQFSQENSDKLNYEVNYPKDLLTIFREARQLENLGFELPSEIHLIALSEQLMINHLFTLNDILNKFQHQVNRRKSENKSVDGLINQLKRGCNWISWMSLNLTHYMDDCKQLLGEINISKTHS